MPLKCQGKNSDAVFKNQGPRVGAPSTESPAPLSPPRTLGGALGVPVTWTGNPHWAAVLPPVGSQDSRSSSSSPWRGGDSGTERLKRPPRLSGGRSGGRSAPDRGRGQASAGPGGTPEAAMFPQTAPRPGAAGEPEDPAAPLRRRPRRAASGRWEREVTAPGLQDSLQAGGENSLWKERNFRNRRLREF